MRAPHHDSEQRLSRFQARSRPVTDRGRLEGRPRRARRCGLERCTLNLPARRRTRNATQSWARAVLPSRRCRAGRRRGPCQRRPARLCKSSRVGLQPSTHSSSEGPVFRQCNRDVLYVTKLAKHRIRVNGAKAPSLSREAQRPSPPEPAYSDRGSDTARTTPRQPKTTT